MSDGNRVRGRYVKEVRGSQCTDDGIRVELVSHLHSLLVFYD